MAVLPTSAQYDRATQQMSGLRRRADDLQAQIASGSRIERSSDDPVAAARLRMLSRQKQLSESFEASANRATGDLAATDTALGSVAEIVIRARELAVQAGNSTLSARDHAAIGEEIRLLQGSLLAIANGTGLTGATLFGGETNGPAYVRDAAGTIVYAGSAVAPTVGLDDGQQVVSGMTGPEVFGFTTGGAGTDLFAVLGTLADDLTGGAADAAGAARGALGALDAGLDKVTTAQTVVGLRLGWLDVVDQRRESMRELESGEEARLGGTDIAATITRLQQVMTVLEASQASFVRLSSLTLFDLLR